MALLDDVIAAAKEMPRAEVAARILIAPDLMPSFDALPHAPAPAPLFGCPVVVDERLRPGDWYVTDREGRVIALSLARASGERG